MSKGRETSSLGRTLAWGAFAVAVLLVSPVAIAEPPTAPGADQDSAKSEDSSETIEERWSEQLVVTATRSDSTAGEVPRHTTVVTREDLDMAPEYGVGDILLRTPSVNVQGDKNTLVAARLDGGIAFRGLGGTVQSRGLVLVDGFPLNDPTGSYLFWTRVPMDDLDRIEVVPGSGGVWGNLALGGTVNLITAAPANSAIGAALRIGDHDTQEGSASYSDLGESWSGSLSASALDTDGFDLLPEDEIRPVNVPWRKDFVTLSGKLGRSFTPSQALHLSGIVFDEDRVLGTPRSIDASDEEAFTAAYDLVSGDDAWQLRAYSRDVGLDEVRPRLIANGTSEAPNGATSNPSRAHGLSALWFSGSAGKNSFSAGTDLQLNTIEAFQDSSFVGEVPTVLTFTEGEQRLAGIFVQDVLQATSRLVLTLDGRFDWVETLDGRRVETNQRTGTSVETILVDSKTETAFNPNLGLVYEASPSVRVRGSAYTGFRAGTPSELFITNTATSKTAANPNLKPERLVGIESGVDYSPSPRLTTRATVYWNQGEDLIERIFIGTAPPGGAVIDPCGFLIAGGQCRERQNLNEVRTYGLELDQDWRFETYWRARLTGTLLSTEVTESPADLTLVGNRVPRTPNQAGSFSLEYANPRLLRAQVRVRYVGDRFDDAPNVDALPERTLVDLAVARDVGKRFQVFANAQNVFDQQRLTDISATTGNELNAPRLLQIGVRFRSR